MRSGQKKVSTRKQLLAAVLLSLLGVAARSQAQGLEPTLIPSPDPDESSFGGTVSLSADGQTALVGGDAGSHRAYVFVHGSGGWSLDTRLPVAGPARDGDAFGWVVALSADGKVALVAAPLTFGSCPDDFPFPCGEVYVYVREGGVWTLKAALKPPTFVDFEFNFGSAIALSGDGSTVLVGRPADDCIHQPCRGVVFVYERAGDSWNLVDSLRASNPSVQKFGSSISLPGWRHGADRSASLHLCRRLRRGLRLHEKRGELERAGEVDCLRWFVPRLLRGLRRPFGGRADRPGRSPGE
ncbi:MAG TPA: hypothetical protein VGP73_00320 [Thermoanaerobaculia bacterium]